RAAHELPGGACTEGVPRRCEQRRRDGYGGEPLAQPVARAAPARVGLRRRRRFLAHVERQAVGGERVRRGIYSGGQCGKDRADAAFVSPVFPAAGRRPRLVRPDTDVAEWLRRGAVRSPDRGYALARIAY